MPLNLTPNKTPAAGTSYGGLDFVLQTATPPQEGKADEYISETREFYKPSR